jgi:hypothetical protein
MATLLVLCALSPSEAQTVGTGRVADSAVGQAGTRQTRDTAAAHGVDATARLENRLRNRVQSRINNRIDRDFAPPTSGTAAFDAAAHQSLRPQ